MAAQEADEMSPAADLLGHLLGELMRRGQQSWPPRRQVRHEGTSVKMVLEKPRVVLLQRGGPCGCPDPGEASTGDAGFPPGRADEKKVTAIVTWRWVTLAAVDCGVPPEKGRSI